ncbi:unnamed protein product [Linum trigynum]
MLSSLVSAEVPRQQGEEELAPPFSHDKRYGLHGEILMLVVVGIFAIFILLLIAVIPCLKRNAAGNHSSEELFSQSSPRGRQLVADKRDE